MIIDDSHYDVIIIGSGAGGGTLAGALSRKGHSVLMLERGEAMALEDQKCGRCGSIPERSLSPKK